MSAVADAEFMEYIEFIISNYKAPATAIEHYDGIMEAIRDLRKNPFVNAVRFNPILQKYGCSVRRVNFKKMAIIYTINENTIHIHRIMPASMITGL